MPQRLRWGLIWIHTGIHIYIHTYIHTYLHTNILTYILWRYYSCSEQPAGDTERSRLLQPGTHLASNFALKELLLQHHLHYYPTRDYRMLRCRGHGYLDIGCSTERFNTPLSQLICSFYVKVRPGKCGSENCSIVASCDVHSCPTPSAVIPNGKRGTPIRSNLALEFC